MFYKTATSDFILIFLVLLISMDEFCGVCALKCWKCIAHDCENDPESNYKATKVDCLEGQQCMKVRYRMYDNITHYDSVIRTCTDQPCRVTTDEEFLKCVNTPKKYMIGGCTLRSCCGDRDCCNTSSHQSSSHLLLLLPSFLFAINSVC